VNTIASLIRHWSDAAKTPSLKHRALGREYTERSRTTPVFARGHKPAPDDVDDVAVAHLRRMERKGRGRELLLEVIALVEPEPLGRVVGHVVCRLGLEEAVDGVEDDLPGQPQQFTATHLVKDRMPIERPEQRAKLGRVLRRQPEQVVLAGVDGRRARATGGDGAIAIELRELGVGLGPERPQRRVEAKSPCRSARQDERDAHHASGAATASTAIWS